MSVLYIRSLPTGEILHALSDINLIQIVFAEHQIIFDRYDLSDTDLVVENIKKMGYNGYDYYSTTTPQQMALHYHEETEARLITGGVGTFFILVGEIVYELWTMAGDFVIIPKNQKHWFNVDEHVSAVRFFETDREYKAIYLT